MASGIINKVKSADNLPSLPMVAMEVLRLTQAEDVSVADIAAVVQRDPALTGNRWVSVWLLVWNSVALAA